MKEFLIITIICICILVYVIKKFSSFRREHGFNRILKKEYERRYGKVKDNINA